MAPWSSRLLSPSTRNEPGSTSTNINSASPARTHTSSSRITESDILESAYGIPTLSGPHGANGISDGASSSSKPTRSPSHGRSMSHPFPSLFLGKKKRHEDGAAGMEFESTDDDSASPPQRLQKAGSASKPTKVLEKDLTTGKCMTCDSMVRWPKDLKVFRCTVCLTINDLKPIALEARRGDGHRAPAVVKPSSHFGSSHAQRSTHQHEPVEFAVANIYIAPMISVERTKRLIDQCITSYLLRRLKHEDTPSPATSPPQSPTWDPVGAGNRQSDKTHPDYPIPPRSTSKSPPIHLSRRPSTNQVIHRDSELSVHLSSGVSTLVSIVRTSSETPITEKDKGGPTSRIRPTGHHNPFKPLEDYIITSFGSFECINNSFSTGRPNIIPRAASEGAKRWMSSPIAQNDRHVEADSLLSELDAKTLLIGDFAENGSWWTGGRSDIRSPERSRTYRRSGESPSDAIDLVTVRSPRIDWADVNEWYYCVINAGRSWRKRLEILTASDLPSSDTPHLSDLELDDIEDYIMEAQFHTQRVLLKATESLLKRPGRPLVTPNEVRFLLIILANPLLYPSHVVPRMRERSMSRSRSKSRSPERNAPPQPGTVDLPAANVAPVSPGSRNIRKGSSGQHSGIIKRILGLLSNVPNECHHHLVSWFARLSEGHFQRTVDLIGSFVTYRLTRQHGKKREIAQDPTAGLIPSMSGSGRASSAALHAALGVSNQSSKKGNGKPQPVVYNDDWQIKAAARVMALLFSANNSGIAKKGETRSQLATQDATISQASRERAHGHGQILPTSDFYNTLLDYSDLIADFEAWEARRGKFSFCQYPFFLSIWAKIQIMEHDARRQMEVKAREAFFDSIMTRKTVNQYLVLRVRRDCLVEDSLKGVSEVVGAGGEEIKKGLRIEFRGEEGIDAGGLRKEWFLLLVRDVFNPEHGMFTYDEESRFCYFNPNSFETTDQFFLVGVVLGLAIYNSTILDVALPPFAFRKLLAAGPTAAPGATSHAKPLMTYSLDDLAEYRPVLANGLRQLLEFDGDVEATFCRDFVADIERYGQMTQIPLCPDGEKRPVTNANRREFVDLYVRYLLDAAVTRQFEPFKRGFFTVCGGNALSLFRPEEIELLIRGSDEPLDIASLRVVSAYENWGVPNAAESEPVVQWFWETFQTATPKDQRKLLSFITGSDRIPAMGATNLVIKLSCLGNDSSRFPVARTCFNILSLWRYSSKAKLEKMLWRAVWESEGFGLK
ncbi:hypothetical protein G7Y89_g2375 [Cudoniella acicularis]|uniref:HECT-type E3 ubiquitin transferase n=1 Tax=Cudoniella acicularis TaxID=354080 RepID=A0A8H4W659_9HELO|nr:hypothetical protein G7Y89_g2375 [Cudoniella acicularis]